MLIGEFNEERDLSSVNFYRRVDWQVGFHRKLGTLGYKSQMGIAMMVWVYDVSRSVGR